MYLAYIDESGDTGLLGSPTNHYILSALVVHELGWQAALDHAVAFRRRMKGAFGLKLREEIHAAHLIAKPGALARLRKDQRLTIVRAHADAIATMPGVSLINVVVDKQGKPTGYDVFDDAWRALLQRMHDAVVRRALPGPRNADDRLMLFPDRTDVSRLDKLVRVLRDHNLVSHASTGHRGAGYRNVPLRSLIEDPNYRDSAHSYFIQAVDTTAWLLAQNLAPASYVRKHAAQNYFLRLRSVLCAAIEPQDPLGIVRL